MVGWSKKNLDDKVRWLQGTVDFSEKGTAG